MGPHKYTVGVPGLGTATADCIEQLRLDGAAFGELVDKAIGGWEQHRAPSQSASSSLPETIWLDIHGPSVADIAALERIFDIDGDTATRLLAAVKGKAVDPECVVRSDNSVYLCWAEVTASNSVMSTYFSRGDIAAPLLEDAATCVSEKTMECQSTMTSDATAVSGQSSGWWGGYIPVPPWMQPSATQALSRMNLDGRQRKDGFGDVQANPQLDDARRQHVQHIFDLIRKPTVSDKERLRAAIRRWGPSHERWWQEVLNNVKEEKATARMDVELLARQLGQGSRDLIGYRIVQVYTFGPVVLTFHRHSSRAVCRTMQELGQKDSRLLATEPLALVQGLVEHWVHATTLCLSVLDRYTDELDRDLTHPVRSLSVEGASWTPVIARCRKASLALLRRCQVNESVLAHFCDAVEGLWFPLTHSSEGPVIRKPPLPTGRRLNIRDISAYGRECQLGILHEQFSRTSAMRGLYKKAEQRLSRLHKILLDRQRLRLLKTQKDIHRYFRVLVTVELVFLPIELWYNVDNLNGITTPGELQPDHVNDSDFWFTVLGIVLWAAAAIALYTVYVKFFERKPNVLRTANMQRMLRNK
ncbi:hypothetical protein GGF46_003451 [Coemansia sp. RSA 552]|nr:hypothetical protein GGF46_003451 [Coemansia sp. RSA 552]